MTVVETGLYDRTREGPYCLDEHTTYDVGVYLAHLKETVKFWNEAFKEVGLPVKASLGDVAMLPRKFRTLQKKEILKSQHRQRFLNGEERGVLHRNQIRTACEVISQQMKNTGQNNHIVGPTQVGKTGSLHACFIALIIRFLLRGKKTTIFYLMPNKKSLEEQSWNEFEIFRDLYGDIEFSIIGTDDDSLGLNWYLDHIAPLKKTEYDVSDPREYRIRKTTSERQIAEFHRMYREKRKAGHYILIIMDEHHHGHHQTGKGKPVAARLMDPILNDIISNSKVSFTGASATAYPPVDLLYEVRHKLDNTYHGDNFWRGEVLDPDVYVTAPRVVSFAAIADEIGLPTQYLSRRAYLTQKGFKAECKQLLKRGDEMPVKTWRAYQQFFLDMLSKVINRMLITHNPHDGKGLCLRLINNNDVMEALLDDGLKCHPDIEMIRYWGKNAQSSVKNILARRENLDRPYVLVITGQGRMADSIPPSCAYFIEMTDKIATHTAEVQGTIGRATGYGKNSLVLTSQKVADSVELFRLNKGLFHKTVIQGCAQAKGGGASGRPRTSIEIPRDVDDPVVAAIFAELDVLYAGGKAQKLKKKHRMNKLGIKAPGGKKQPTFFTEIFTEERLQYLEGKLGDLLPAYYPFGIELLRMGDITNGGGKAKTYDATVGCRLVDANKSITAKRRHNGDVHGQHSDILERLKSTRTLPGGGYRHSAAQIELHQPQVHFKYHRGNLKITPVAVGLLLAKPTQTHTKPTDVVWPHPDALSWWWGWMTPQQKKVASKVANGKKGGGR